MIKSVKVLGWKSSDGSIDLGITNVLVGPNGSGKTSVMDAIRLAATGEVPGLGKTNQSLIKGASCDNPTVSIETSDGEVSLSLAKARSTVSKSVDGEQWSPVVPLSVPEFQALTAAELRTLLSVGADKITRSQFKRDILTKAGSVAKHCMSLFNDVGEGTLNDLDLWIEELKVIAKTQASNLRESESALANVRKNIAECKTVPQRVISEWEAKKSSLQATIRETEEQIRGVGGSVASAKRLREKLEELDITINNLTDRKIRLQDAERQIRNLKKECDGIDKARISKLRDDLTGLEERQRQTVDHLAGRANFSKWLEDAADKILEAVSRYAFDGQDKAMLERISKTMCICADNIHEDEEPEKADLAEKIQAIKVELANLTNPATELNRTIGQFGFDSYGHFEQAQENCEVQIASRVKEQVATLKELRAIEESMKVELTGDPEAIQNELEKVLLSSKAELHELVKQINMQAVAIQLKASEADLVEQIEKISEWSESSKAAVKCAEEVQAQYLDEPIESIKKHLDDFCEEVGLPKIRCAFIKQGRAITLEVNLMRKKPISLDTLSGGERLLVGCAFLYALNMIHKPKHPLILVESAELDKTNADRLLKGLCFAGDNGVQSIMTSFEELGSEGLYESITVGAVHA